MDALGRPWPDPGPLRSALTVLDGGMTGKDRRVRADDVRTRSTGCPPRPTAWRPTSSGMNSGRQRPSGEDAAAQARAEHDPAVPDVTPARGTRALIGQLTALAEELTAKGTGPTFSTYRRGPDTFARRIRPPTAPRWPSSCSGCGTWPTRWPNGPARPSRSYPSTDPCYALLGLPL